MNCCVSGKILETAWRIMHSRQATHMIFCLSGILWEEPPGGTFPTARRCIEFLPNSGFLDVGSGGMDELMNCCLGNQLAKTEIGKICYYQMERVV